MSVIQNAKLVAVTPPGAIVDNAAYTTAIVDTEGYGYVDIVVLLGATDIAMAALKVTESDDSGMSGAADITGLVCGTSAIPETGATSALPSATDDNKFFAFSFTTTGRKRYIDISATGGDGTAGTYATIIAILSDGRHDLNTQAARGIAQHLIA